MLRVRVRVWSDSRVYNWGAEPFIDYVMDYNNDVERRRLAESCRAAFEAGQVVVTVPL